MKSKCKNIDLLDYSEGLIFDERAAEVRKHLKECQDCRNFLQLLGSIDGIIEKERMVGENPFFFTRVEQRMRRPLRNEESIMRKLIPTFVAALFFIGGVVAGVNIGKLYGNPDSSADVLSFETKQFLDDMAQEPIESYLINLNDGNDDEK